MSYDHLFTGYDRVAVGSDDDFRLRHECQQFVRSPGALTFLLDRVADPATTNDEAFALSEVLTFWTGVDLPGDDALRVASADRALSVLERGKADQLNAEYEQFNIGRRLAAAAQKASTRPSATAAVERSAPRHSVR